MTGLERAPRRGWYRQLPCHRPAVPPAGTVRPGPPGRFPVRAPDRAVGGATTARARTGDRCRRRCGRGPDRWSAGIPRGP